MGKLIDIMKLHHGLDISDDDEKLLMDDLNLIIEVNKTMNLTRIASIESGTVLHLEDSLAGLPFVKEAPEGLYGDMGTGGGFPGIPLCLMTRRQTVLIDSVGKKVKALEGVAEELGIGDLVEGYAGRLEDLAKQRKGEFSVLTARALSSLSSLLELASPLLKKGGRLICYKAQPSDEEVEEAYSILSLVGMSNVSRETFSLSDGSTRCIFVFEKTGNPKIKLPRRVGMAQNNPLKPRV